MCEDWKRKGNRKRGKVQPKGGREEERDYRGIGETAKRPWEQNSGTKRQRFPQKHIVP